MCKVCSTATNDARFRPCQGKGNKVRLHLDLYLIDLETHVFFPWSYDIENSCKIGPSGPTFGAPGAGGGASGVLKFFGMNLSLVRSRVECKELQPNTNEIP